MKFLKIGNIYKIIRITGSQDNLLGITFDETKTSKSNPEVIKWNFPNSDKGIIQTSEKEVLEQVLLGLESVNKALETDYKLSKIYFSPFDSSRNQIYVGLLATLIRHYHTGNEFKEVQTTD